VSYQVIMTKVKILFFAADPLSAPPDGDTPRLRLDDDVREIQRKVRAAEHRHALDFDHRWAARTDDLLQALNETHPRVVHFSGHGGNEGLVLVSSDGRGPHRVDAAVLAQLFRLFRDDIRLVVLNACYSLPQAEAIADVVGCAIGTPGTISDEAAITFGASFYRAVAFGHSVQAAFDQARTALALEHFEDWECPQLVARPDVDPAQLVLVPPVRVEEGARDAGALDRPENAGTHGPLSLASPSAPTTRRWNRGRVGVVATAATLTVAAVVASATIDWPPGGGPQIAACVAAEAPRTLVGLPAPPAPGGDAVVDSGLAAARDLERAGNHAAAFPRFERAAKAGSPEAMAFLGIAYLRGLGTKQRPEEGIEWLRKAAYRRDARAMNTLAGAYRNGEGVPRSRRWARYWYQIAAKGRGCVEPMRSLGRLFQEEHQFDRALVWYEKAARAGSVEAMVDAGWMYEEGLGVRRNPEEARRWYRTAAAGGSPRGMLAMGWIYQESVGVPRDYALARAWYRKAAQAGSAGAMNNLGLLYLNGWGVERDSAEAIRWFRRARDAGSTVAAGNLTAVDAR